MYETPDELVALQALLDRSAAAMGEHMASIVKPERRMTAEQVVAELVDTRHVALATVTSDGRPRVMPVDALFLHGRFYAMTSATSLRARHLRRNPAVSASYFVKDSVAVTVHGTATLVGSGHPEFEPNDVDVRRIYGSSITDWGPDNVFVRIDADAMFTYVR